MANHFQQPLPQPARTQISWSVELMRWHAQHPEYKPLSEDSDSQRFLIDQDDNQID